MLEVLMILVRSVTVELLRVLLVVRAVFKTCVLVELLLNTLVISRTLHCVAHSVLDLRHEGKLSVQEF